MRIGGLGGYLWFSEFPQTSALWPFPVSVTVGPSAGCQLATVFCRTRERVVPSQKNLWRCNVHFLNKHMFTLLVPLGLVDFVLRFYLYDTLSPSSATPEESIRSHYRWEPHSGGQTDGCTFSHLFTSHACTLVQQEQCSPRYLPRGFPNLT